VFSCANAGESGSEVAAQKGAVFSCANAGRSGTEVAAQNAAVFSCANAGESGSELATRKGAAEGPAREVVEVAELALGRLGMGARERREKLRRVVEGGGQRAWNEAELVRAVLSAA